MFCNQGWAETKDVILAPYFLYIIYTTTTNSVITKSDDKDIYKCCCSSKLSILQKKPEKTSNLFSK